jgi:hypothetical protein
MERRGIDTLGADKPGLNLGARGATDCSLALPALGGDRGFREVGSASNGEGALAWTPLTDQPTRSGTNRAPISLQQPLQHQLAILGAQLTIALPGQAGLAQAVGGGVDTGVGHDTSLGLGSVSCWFRGLWGGDCRWVGVLRGWSHIQTSALRVVYRIPIKSWEYIGESMTLTLGGWISEVCR